MHHRNSRKYAVTRDKSKSCSSGCTTGKISFSSTQIKRAHCLLRPQSLKSDFKKPGKHAMNVFRSVMITGPPGIGKTTSAHLCAKLEGYTVIELNASDARSKKLVEVFTCLSIHEFRVDCSSLLVW
jgi:hypothetical protein